MPHPRLSVGILTADLADLPGELGRLDDRADWVHVDVFDGTFGPGPTVGAGVLPTVADSGKAVDVHLLVSRPRRLLGSVVDTRPSIVTVQAEADDDLAETLGDLAAAAPGVIRGVGLAPGTDVFVIESVLHLVDLVLVLGIDPRDRGPLRSDTGARIDAVRGLIRGRPTMVGLDGGVGIDTAPRIAGWHPDLVVSGSAVFDGGDPVRNLDRLVAALAGADAAEADADAAVREVIA